MSKVAINGRKIPVVPLAGIVAGLLAAIGFFMLPQSVLEAFVWQLRLDTVLSAAKPPLGVTAKLLAAIGAGLATGLFTALLAWKFTKADKKAPDSVSTRRMHGADSAPVENTVTAPHIVPDSAQDTAVKAEKKSRFRLGRKAKEDEIDVAAMPVTRNRGLTGTAQRQSVFDHEDQSGGNALDISTANDSLQERQVDLPDWAYEENCDLSGVRSGITEPASPEINIDDAVPVVDETADPFALQDIIPEPFTPEPYEPVPYEPATAEASAIELESSLADMRGISGPREDALDAGKDNDHEPTWQDDGPALDQTSSTDTVEEWGEADWSQPVEIDHEPADGYHHDAYQTEIAPPQTLAADLISDVSAKPDSYEPVEDASIDQLLDRAEAGLRRRAEARIAARNAAISAPAPAPAVVPASSESSTAIPPVAPSETPNPFAGFEHKEAEVDEALRAALSTLERMNRRSA